jgi:hypothetical protein
MKYRYDCGWSQTHVLVEVERRDAAEIEPFIAMQSDQLLIQPQRRPAGGEAEHGIRFLPNDGGNNLGAENAADLGGIADEDFHGIREACATPFSVSIPESGRRSRRRNPACRAFSPHGQSSRWP